MSKEIDLRTNIDDFLCTIKYEIAMLRRALKVSGAKSLALQPVVSALDVYAEAIQEKVETYAADLREEGYR